MAVVPDETDPANPGQPARNCALTEVARAKRLLVWAEIVLGVAISAGMVLQSIPGVPRAAVFGILCLLVVVGVAVTRAGRAAGRASEKFSAANDAMLSAHRKQREVSDGRADFIRTFPVSVDEVERTLTEAACFVRAAEIKLRAFYRGGLRAIGELDVSPTQFRKRLGSLELTRDQALEAFNRKREIALSRGKPVADGRWDEFAPMPPLEPDANPVSVSDKEALMEAPS